MSVFTLFSLTAISIIILPSCANEPKSEIQKKESLSYINTTYTQDWDCPDNLDFPAIELKDWHKVPVVNGRFPTKTETENGTSLLFINKSSDADLNTAALYPMTLPKLAYFLNPRTQKKEIVIIIQLVQFSDYVWAGLRYVTGGNASTKLDKLQLLTDEEVKKETGE